jgi:hypothetical protein
MTIHSCQTSQSLRFVSSFIVKAIYKRSQIQERFLERYEQRERPDVSYSDKDSMIEDAYTRESLDERIDDLQDEFDFNPPVEWNPDTKYNCYNCSGVLSVGPYSKSAGNRGEKV